MLKIRRPLGRLIFNMGIAIPGKTVFLIETAPRSCRSTCPLWSFYPYKQWWKQSNCLNDTQQINSSHIWLHSIICQKIYTWFGWLYYNKQLLHTFHLSTTHPGLLDWDAGMCMIVPMAANWHRKINFPDSKVHGTIWGPPGADGIQLGPVLLQWSLLSE